MSEPQFVTGYAKSEMSRCRHCREIIRKSELRLAFMAQSKNRDGKDPHWHHFNCFFARPRGLAFAAMLSGFENLRPHDQAMIVNRIAAPASYNFSAPKSRPVPTDGLKGAPWFVADYAKSDRSTCRKCKKYINVGVLRLARMVQSNYRDAKEPHWHHFDCFFAKPRGLTSISLLNGFADLLPKDQALVDEHIHAASTHSGATKRRAETAGISTSGGKRIRMSPASPGDVRTLLAAQSQCFQYIKNELENYASVEQLRYMLMRNDIKFNERARRHTLVPRVAKLIQFGIPPKCPECGGPERLRFMERSSTWYCGAQLQYSPCTYKAAVQDIDTRPFALPINVSVRPRSKAKANEDPLASFAAKAMSWIMSFFIDSNSSCAPSTTAEEVEILEPIGATPFEQSMSRLAARFARPHKPVGTSGADDLAATRSVTPSGIFAGLVFTHARPAQSRLGNVRKLIEENGGIWSARVTSNVSYVIELPEKYSRTTSDAKSARNYGAEVVREQFITDCISCETLLCSRKYRLDFARRKGKGEPGKGPRSTKSRIKAMNEKEVVPPGARVAVHHSARMELGEDVRVLDLGGDMVFHAVLSRVSIGPGRNSNYKLQVLVLGQSYWVSREYGRTGTAIGSDKLTLYTSATSAITEFQRIFAKKTGNDWDARSCFEKKPGMMAYIESELLDAAEVARSLAARDDRFAAQRAAVCKLHPRVVDLIELIFNKELMESAMLEMEIDLSSFPLGALTAIHVEKGYKTLSEIADVLSGHTPFREKNKQLRALSDKFFHIIPSKSISLIDSAEKVAKKAAVVDALRNMEVAARFVHALNDAGGRSRFSEVEAKYEQLGAHLVPLEVGGADWSLLDECVQNTSRGCASWFGGSSRNGASAETSGLKIIDAYAVSRDGEDARFANVGGRLGNRRLLWHGGRTSSFCGILSQGLRKAPPEAPSSGYPFGKGVYFADLVSASAACCGTRASSHCGPAGDMLVAACEVALGASYAAYRAEFMEAPRPGTSSTHAVGAWGPDPAQDLVTRGGVRVARGRVVGTGARTSPAASAFVVYDEGQIRMRYILRLSADAGRRAAAAGPVARAAPPAESLGAGGVAPA